MLHKNVKYNFSRQDLHRYKCLYLKETASELSPSPWDYRGLRTLDTARTS